MKARRKPAAAIEKGSNGLCFFVESLLMGKAKTFSHSKIAGTGLNSLLSPALT
jgi:hypothetical protein